MLVDLVREITEMQSSIPRMKRSVWAAAVFPDDLRHALYEVSPRILQFSGHGEKPVRPFFCSFIHGHSCEMILVVWKSLTTCSTLRLVVCLVHWHTFCLGVFTLGHVRAGYNSGPSLVFTHKNGGMFIPSYQEIVEELVSPRESKCLSRVEKSVNSITKKWMTND